MRINIPDKNIWHAMSIKQIFVNLQSSVTGLSEKDAKIRIRKFGFNLQIEPKRRSGLKILLSQFNNFLIYVLLASAFITLLIGKYTDTSVILAVVFLNAIIGFLQEGKAEKAVQAVNKMLSLSATVIREQKRMDIAAKDLVPGDIVVLQSGDKIPADIRLFEIKNFQVSESLLTGESVPVQKTTEPLPENLILGDQTNMAFAGCLVTTGKAHGIVVATGRNTEIGKIGDLLQQTNQVTTPLIKKVSSLSKKLTLVILLATCIIFSLGFWLHSYNLEEILMASVGISVAAIPEGLPIILTITLAIGVQRMAKRNAIIRILPSVETLGSVMIICSDKTGTLTKNQMTAQAVNLGGEDILVTGSGYEPEGEFYQNKKLLELNSEANQHFYEICKAAILCNEAHFEIKNQEINLIGDPTEGALLTLAMKANLNPELLRKEYPLTDLIPFESEHRFMASLHHDHLGNGYIYIKGAPESIFKKCSQQKNNNRLTNFDLAYWQKKIADLAALGQRTLAIAFKSVSEQQRELSFKLVEDDFIFLGVIGIIDPPREEAIESISECHKAGIKVKMITGDHPITAKEIARQIGINHHRVLTGIELEQMGDEQFLLEVDQVDIFARTNPSHKLRLVTALQSKGYIVAMTGDGVNDAPALKRADIGIAMGLKGTEAAKEASEMVLTDDNFSSIVEAIKQGRTVYDNLKKVIRFLLPINGGESLSLVVAILFGYILPITPLQILWVNMVSSVALAMSLAFEPTERSAMYRKPSSSKESLLSRALVWRIFFVSIIFLTGIFGMFKLANYFGASIENARTLAINSLVVMEVFYLLSTRNIYESSIKLSRIFNSRIIIASICTIIILQLFFTYTPLMNHFFSTAPLSLFQIFSVIALGILVFFIFEAEKILEFKFSKNLNFVQ